MNAAALAGLCRIAAGARLGSDGVTNLPVVTPEKLAVTPVTSVTPLRDEFGKAVREGPDVTQIQERAGMADDRVPALYLDAWAGLNCQKPTHVSEAEWQLALDIGGRFLDAWGLIAAQLQWTAGDLFDVPHDGRPGGLVWRLDGQRVEALGFDHARLGDERVITRGEFDRTERTGT